MFGVRERILPSASDATLVASAPPDVPRFVENTSPGGVDAWTPARARRRPGATSATAKQTTAITFLLNDTTNLMRPLGLESFTTTRSERSQIDLPESFHPLNHFRSSTLVHQGSA